MKNAKKFLKENLTESKAVAAKNIQRKCEIVERFH
jgi:hypothetical protein